MNSRSQTWSSLLIGLFLTCATSACSSESPSPSGPASTAGSSGQTATPGGGAGGSSTAGSGGSVVSGGAGGSTPVAGSGGSTPTAGAGGSGGSGGGVTDLYSCAPGTSGDGFHDQPEPYTLPPESYPIDANPKGTLSDLTPFPSTIYEGHEFHYQVYVPSGYTAGTPVNLMVVPDGPGHYMNIYKIKDVLDNLIASGEVPPTIALLIDAGTEDDRIAIFDHPDERFTNFLVTEIIPSVITSQYDIIMDRDAWTMLGYSGGAMQALAATIYQPDLFAKALTDNGSFPAGVVNGLDVEAMITAGPTHNIRVSLLSGTNDIVDNRGNWLEANTAMANALIAKGEVVRMMSGTGGHYPPEQAAADFPNAMRWMFERCP